MFGMIGESAGEEYFVAPNGSDANPGTQAAPFKTIQKAASMMVAGDTCRIRAGTYRETVIPVNSGKPGAPITFQAFQHEKVVISGADVVSAPWKKHKGDIYTASMPWTMGPGKDMVFVDGVAVVQARHPNSHTSGRRPPPIGLPPLWMTFGNFSVHLDSPDISNPTDLDQDRDDYWKGAIYVGWHGWGWCLQSAEVESSRRGYISVKNKTGQWWFPDTVKKWGLEKKFRWFQQGYLTHHLNALDKPGEWHWQNDRLYLWAHDNRDPSDRLVEAKKRHLAFDLRNKDHISLKGLRTFASSITMYNANHCVIDGCRMSFVSHYTLFDDGGSGYVDDYKVQDASGAPQRGEVGVYIGGKNNVIKNSVVKYSAGAGLILAGYRTTVTNSIIHDCGYVGTYLGCIFITYDPTAKWEEPRGGHTITHNELYRSGRALIYVMFDHHNHFTQQTVYKAMDIGYNRFHDGAITANDAGGAFNCYGTTLGSGKSRTQIHHNLMWDVWGYVWTALVYPDNRSYAIDIHHNVLWQSSRVPRKQPHFNVFYHHNKPGDPRYFNNVEKSAYDGGVTGLKASDYPGGYFKTGPTIQDEEDSWLEPPVSLNEAAAIGNFGLVKSLIAKGAEVDGREDGTFKTALHHAAISGHKDIVGLLLAKGADIDAGDSSGSPGLHYAAEKGHKEIAELLIAEGANVNAKNASGDTPLHYAARSGAAGRDIIELLIAKGAAVNVKNNNDQTPSGVAIGQSRKEIVELLIEEGATISTIHTAAYLGNLQSVKTFIEKGIQVDARIDDGETPLELAVSAGHSDLVTFLIDKGAEVNSRNERNRTPLYHAVWYGQKGIVELLIAKGVDVNAKDNRGYTPLHFALLYSKTDIARLLINKGADVHAKDRSGYTPLHWAVMMGNRELTRLVLSKGADVNVKGKAGETPLDFALFSEGICQLLVDKGAEVLSLQSAALTGDLDKVTTFISEGADVNKPCFAGVAVLHVAAGSGHKDIVEFLIAKGANINASARRGQTPLHWAAGKGHRDIVELLIEKGADVNAKDRRGRTPLDLAVDRGHTEIVELLPKRGAKEQ